MGFTQWCWSGIELRCLPQGQNAEILSFAQNDGKGESNGNDEMRGSFTAFMMTT